MNTKYILPLVLLIASLACVAFGESALYPNPTKPSWGAVWSWGQPRIASGTDLPDIASASIGDLFVVSPEHAGTPRMYRAEWIMTYSGLLASWTALTGTGSGGGVTVYDDLTGKPTSASWTYNELQATPTSSAWNHDELTGVADSTGHDTHNDGRYARPASTDPTYWQGYQYISGNGNALYFGSGSSIIALHDGLTDAPFDIRRYSDTSSTRIMGGSTMDDGASIVLSGQNANSGAKCAVTITAHGGADALDGAITLRTYDATASQILNRLQVGKTGVVRIVPQAGAPGDETDHVWWDVTNSEMQRGCMYFDSTDDYLYLIASHSGGLDWHPVARASGDESMDFACKDLTAAGNITGAHVASDSTPGITQEVDIPYQWGVSTCTFAIKDGLIVSVSTP